MEGVMSRWEGLQGRTYDVIRDDVLEALVNVLVVYECLSELVEAALGRGEGRLGDAADAGWGRSGIGRVGCLSRRDMNGSWNWRRWGGGREGEDGDEVHQAQ